MNMPTAIQHFFNEESLDTAMSAFAEYAVVKDEGNTYTGRTAIRAWRVASREQYDFVSEPFDMFARGDIVTIRANVSGNFPGSPVVLDYNFRLLKDRIVELEIGYAELSGS